MIEGESNESKKTAPKKRNGNDIDVGMNYSHADDPLGLVFMAFVIIGGFFALPFYVVRDIR